MSQPHQPYPGPPEHPPGSGAPWSGQPAPAQPPPGQPHYGQPIPGQPIPGQPIPGQPIPGQPIPGQPFSAAPASGQPGPGQPSYYGQPAPGQPIPGQPFSAAPVPGQPVYPQPDPTRFDQSQPGYAQPGYPPGGFPQPGHPQADYPQPGYPQADHSQPGYPQADYAQTGYTQAGYTQAGYPPAGPPVAGYPGPPKPKSRALPITLVSIAVVLVLCVGGSTVLYLIGRNTAKSLSGTQATTGPSIEPTTSTITVVEPETLGGRPKLTDPEFEAAAEQLERSLAQVPNTTQAIGGLYGEAEKQDIVIVVAATAPVRDPEGELDSLFAGASGSGVKLTGLSTAYAGPLGGVGKCGRSTVSGAPLIMCGWADSGSVGWLIWYYASMGEAKAEFPKLRGEVEKSN